MAETCCYDFTVAVAGQTLLTLVMFVCMECVCQEGSTEDDVIFAVKDQAGGMVINTSTSSFSHSMAISLWVLYVFDFTHPRAS